MNKDEMVQYLEEAIDSVKAMDNDNHFICVLIQDSIDGNRVDIHTIKEEEWLQEIEGQKKGCAKTNNLKRLFVKK